MEFSSLTLCEGSPPTGLRSFKLLLHHRAKSWTQKRDIVTFQQGVQENFQQHWERFGVLTRRHLDHGYSEDRLNKNFVNGLLENYKEIIERSYPTGFRYNDLEKMKELCGRKGGSYYSLRNGYSELSQQDEHRDKGASGKGR
ncbi:unnamed protein product [Linum trigynum]|uniref:Uncharacterized protein n=1 Tax=Linum trigynum TaxID=586398 RepID=A0AAV2CFR9_9ROSI